MPNEYMTPEIGRVIPMLSQTCNDLTRQALIRGITEKTQEWVEGDPELADILLEGKKTLEECVRYVTEKAACVIAKNVNSMLNAELENLPKMKIQGRDATMAGGAIDAEQVYKWAQEYYYTPDAKPTDFKKEAEQKKENAKREAERKKNEAARKAKADKKGAKKPDVKATTTATDTDAETDDEDDADDEETAGSSQDEAKAKEDIEQFSLFGSEQNAA
jgi:hypothetical protein